MKSKSAQPIFVIGRQRSGTTWMTNLLAAHPAVFTPEHEAHKGQHESAYFSSLVPYCNWGATEQDRKAISAVFERSDYWHLLFPKNCPNINIEDCGFSEYFRAAMDDASRRRNCTHWVEKTPGHTLMLTQLIEWFPDAIFIAVERTHKDIVRSNVYKFGQPNRSLDWVKAAIWGEIYTKTMKYHKDTLYFVNYDRLLSDFEQELDALFQSIGLCKPVARLNRWLPDSSYDHDPPQISLRFRVLIKLVATLFAHVPANVCCAFTKEWITKRKSKLPAWFFKVYQGNRIVSDA